jgi:hypothetical protein
VPPATVTVKPRRGLPSLVSILANHPMSLMALLM